MNKPHSFLFASFLALLTFWSIPAHCQDQKTKQDQGKKEDVFTSEYGGFQVRMINPKSSIKKLQPSSGKFVELYLFVDSVVEKQVAQSVSFHDLEKELITDAEIKKILDQSEKGFSDTIQGKISESKDMEFATLPGRQFEFQASNFQRNARGICRILIRKNRVYQLTYSATSDRYDAKQALAYLDSFRTVRIDLSAKPKQKTTKPVEPPPVNEKSEKKAATKLKKEKKASK